MAKKWDQIEHKRHPIQPILDRIPEEWGKYVRVGDGWYDLVLELDKELATIEPDYVVHQCKSKFGGLRYYTNIGSSVGLQKISDAENKSHSICEVCGAPGKSYSKGWIATLCDKHAREIE